MDVGDFDYDLPPEAIAQHPVEPRDAARLLVAVGDDVVHSHVRDLPELLGEGDLLVANRTRVLPARLHLRKPTGGEVEVLLLERTGDRRWHALVRHSRRVAPGTTLLAGARPVVVVGDRAGRGREVTLLVDERDLTAIGEVPLPPYVHAPLADPGRYQTVYARPDEARSAAAPTAGLHLTPAVIDACRAKGVDTAYVDLDVGLATFSPMTSGTVEDHVMHEERYEVAQEVWARCQAARRVVAVGTTTVRALESAARGAHEGRTDLFITPGFDFRVVDVLLTNFHLPRSSLLVLLEAFAGPRWRALYAEALEVGYRFLSFGDAMLVGRASPVTAVR